MRRIAGLAMLACLVSCLAPTEYVPLGKDWKGGYTDSHIYGNVYMVTFKGNGVIDRGTVTQYAHRRAGELCQEKGFGGYELLQELQAVASYSPPKPEVSIQIECVGSAR